MLTLPGYRIVEELPRRGSAAAYRALRASDGVAVRVLTAPAGSDGAARLVREYANAADLDIPGMIRPIACESHGGPVVLVRATCEGKPLGQCIPARGMPLPQALRVAGAAARALDDLHRRRRLHLGLTPEAVLVDAADQVRLTDFGQAANLAASEPEELAAPENPAYMSPEQTGRTGNQVGPGSDLYALGILLFQMLTGELPFRVNDALDWFHCHIARVPAAPRSLRPNIPPQVEAIVLKLLAKMPEERYRSAAGLAWDLFDCAARIEAGGDWQGFRPGAHDAAPTLAIPAHLYGREAQRAALLDTWRRASAGRAELILITGPAGLGKSALVQELQPAASLADGHFIAGKFDERNRTSPYSSIIQALQELVRQVLAESDEQLAHWRDKLSDALGANGQVIVDTVQQAELVLGPQPALQELPPAQTAVRFQRSLHDFVTAFAEAKHPLAIFLDDLQWADAASLELLRNGLSDPDTRHLLIIGAYRDNEVTADHPLNETVRRIEEAGVRCTRLSLAPLDEGEIGALIADTLHNASTADLAELVQEKTGGNPLFVRQFLLNLYTEGLLGWDAPQGRWTWDMARIEAAELSDDVAELMAQRVRRLSLIAQRSLQIAACIGNRFSASLVAAVASDGGYGSEDIAAALTEAVRHGFIAAVAASGEPDVYRFGHDRIQQAAYAMLHEVERKAMHLAAGRALLAREEGQGEIIFDIANQFQYCLDQLIDAGERRRLAAVFAQAGTRAKAAAAYSAARDYLIVAAKLADEDLWRTDRTLAVQLFADRAECEFLCGHAEEAEALFTRVLERAREPADIARLYVLRMHLHMSQGRSDRALAVGRQGLARLGTSLPHGNARPAALVEIARIGLGLHGRRIEDLADLPAMTDPVQQAVMHIFMNMTVAAYFVDRNLLALIAMRMVSLSMRYGNADSSPYAYVTAGMVIGGGFQRYRDGFRFGELGRRLGEASGDIRQRGLALSMCGIFTGKWGQPLDEIVRHLRRAMRDLLDCGNLMMANYTAIATMYVLDDKGEALPALDAEVLRLSEFVRKIGFHDSEHYFLSTHRKILCLQGGTDAPGSLGGAGYDETQHIGAMRGMKEQTAVAWHFLNRLQVAYLFGRLEDAKAATKELDALQEASLAQQYVARHMLYAGLTETALASSARGMQRRRHLGAARRYGRRLRALADASPTDYRHLDLLATAALAEAVGAEDTARRYERAVAAAADSEHVHDWALANERAASHLLRHGVATAASRYLGDACGGYRQWGAEALALALERRHPDILGRASVASAASDEAPIDMAAVIKASQAISGEIEFGGLLRRLMEALAVHAGAARMVFILKRDDGLSIEEEWRAGDDARKCAGPMPLALCTDIAHTVVQYSARTLSEVVIDDASRDNAFTTDTWLANGSQKSLLCLPIIRHGTLLGVLYMENPLLRGAFHRERLRVLKLLTAQLAISIENANLYERLRRASEKLEDANRGLEEKVAARTRELSEEIAERKRIEAALREASTAADAANRAKSAFLANMSHEIRTPMNAIIGLSQLALRTELTPQQYGYLKKIDGAAELLLGLINDTLDMAKIEAGKMTLEAIPFSIDEVITRVSDTMEMAAQEKGIELVVHRSREIPCLLVGDPLRLGQVLLNLANNAVKFTSSGEVALSVERERFDEAAGEIVLRFSVTDTGIGISEQQLARLFQPFSQADNSVTRTHGGTGLGLTIVKELVQMMGGAIEVASAPGVGSDFSFSARFGVAPAAAVADSSRAPDYAGLRVLVVDDNDSARMALQHVLETSGCQVVAASGGTEALTALRTAAAAGAPVQLVMMDWNMPGMDGIETAQRIQNDPGIPQQPVVVMVTAYSRDEVASRASRLQTEIDAYLLKPVKPRMLYSAISRIFGLAREEAAEPALRAPAPKAEVGGRLLVVEDNAYNQLVARELLQGAGFTVDIAENGREAVDRVLNTEPPYDAVLMDVQMPVMDGWAATRILRGHARGRHLPIIGMTAYTMTEDLDRCRESGMDDVVTKPVRLDKLLEVLGRAFQQPSRQATADAEEAVEGNLIDVAGALERLAGNRGLLDRLLTDFCETEGDTAIKVRELIVADRIEEAGRLVHTTKGTAMILGLGRFTATAAKLENALRQSNRDLWESLLPAFAAELDAALTACRQAVSATSAPTATAAAADDESTQWLIDRLATLIDRSSMSAIEIVPQLHSALNGTPHVETIAEIDASLNKLDFEAARRHLQRLMEL